jgi:hypothetical protein
MLSLARLGRLFFAVAMTAFEILTMCGSAFVQTAPRGRIATAGMLLFAVEWTSALVALAMCGSACIVCAWGAQKRFHACRSRPNPFDMKVEGEIRMQLMLIDKAGRNSVADRPPVPRLHVIATAARI